MELKHKQVLLLITNTADVIFDDTEVSNSAEVEQDDRTRK